MKISDKRKERIFEQILAHLYQESPKSLYTSHIAQELARDEEFIKRLLIELKQKKLIIEVKKNSQGIPYIRRSRWKLSEGVYNAYKKLNSF